MTLQTEKSELRILRALAAEYAACAADPVNAERRVLHTAVNDLRLMRPVVLVDELPWSELNGNGELTLCCQDPDYREAEDFFRKELYRWKYFQGDRILQPFYAVRKRVEDTGIGVTVEERRIHGPLGDISAHEYVNQFESIEDVEKLHHRKLTYLREPSMEKLSKLTAAIGDLLPVKLCGLETGYDLSCKNWDDISMFMGVEDLMYGLVDEPDMMHALADRLTDIFLDTIRQIETLELFEPDQIYLHSVPALNSTLGRDLDPLHVRAKNMWGRGIAQIFSSVSADMREEFDIEYQKRAMAPFGLVYYGCCEPLHNMIDIVEKIPNIRKITVTPWADPVEAAEHMGNRYVMAFKPNPAYVTDFDTYESRIGKEIDTMLEAVRRNQTPCDIVLKDISTVNGKLENLIRWEKLVMDRVRRFEY